MFLKLDLFPPAGDGKKAPALLGLLERPNLSYLSSDYLRTETSSFQMLCFLVFRILVDGQSPEPQ
jgi:hypothetical protein